MNEAIVMDITVELFKHDDGTQGVFISKENSSGCEYEVNDLDEIGNLVVCYIRDCIEEN